jgi:hypothetical protein
MTVLDDIQKSMGKDYASTLKLSFSEGFYDAITNAEVDVGETIELTPA